MKNIIQLAEWNFPTFPRSQFAIMIVATNQQNPIGLALRGLTREKLERIVLDIHDVLFLEIDGNTMTVNPDKEFDEQTIELVSEVLTNHGIAPDSEYLDKHSEWSQLNVPN